MSIYYIILIVIILILICWGIFTNWKYRSLKKSYFISNRDYLLFSCIGDRPESLDAVNMWLKNNNRNYDIVLYYYKIEPNICKCEKCVYKNGFKFENFYDFASTNDISKYKAIWIPDDDIQIEVADINTMFDIFMEYKLDLAMPAFSEDSEPKTKLRKDVLFQKKGNILHYTNFIENNSPIFTQESLIFCLPTFKNAKTGYSLDYIWSNLLEDKKIAVIDSTPFSHKVLTSDLDKIIPRTEHQIHGQILEKKWGITHWLKTWTPKILDYVKDENIFNPSKEYLLFSSVGNRESFYNSINLWTEDNDREYDIVLYYYKSIPQNCEVDYCKYRKGFKFENFLDFQLKNDISKYKAIWIPDDDIQINSKDINKMFNLFMEYELDLAMPAFSNKSFPINKIREQILFQKKENILHYTNFIEVIAPIFTQESLKICLPTFNNSQTGYSLDKIWSNLLEDKKIAVIDSTPFLHDSKISDLDETKLTGLKRFEHKTQGKELEKKWGITHWLKSWSPMIKGELKDEKRFISSKEYLLFSSVGDRENSEKAFHMWSDNKNRNYDIAIYYFKSKPENCKVDYCKYKKGFKFENFLDFESKNDISKYKAIWIPDDDIQISSENINKMFNLFMKYELDLAMPAFSDNSQISHVITKTDSNYILRYSNFVENGVVIFSQESLKICLSTFKDSKSGYGLDYIWSHLLKNKKLGIIDATPCFHDYSMSELDIIMPRNGKNSQEEYGINLLNKWGLDSIKPAILGYVKKKYLSIIK